MTDIPVTVTDKRHIKLDDDITNVTPLSENFGAPAVLTKWCNIYGGEWDGGAKRVLGGIGPQTPSKQWYCPTPAIGRYRAKCEHGHQGQPMDLCQAHLNQYRDQIRFCPRCNANDDHKCKLLITEMS